MTFVHVISCELVPESQGHLLQCPKLVTKLTYLCGKTSKLNEDDIYSDDISKQEIIVNIYSDLLEVRENLENIPYLQGSGPMHNVVQHILCNHLYIILLSFGLHKQTFMFY